MDTNTPALNVITRNGQVRYVVHGVIECTSLDAAMDLLYDRRVAPRSQMLPEPTCVAISTDEGGYMIRWEGYEVTQ